MANQDLQLRRSARTAGRWYFVMAIVGAFCLLYVPSKIMVAGDAEATVSNILANETLFRVGILADLISQFLFIITVLYLYRLFKEVNLQYARLMVALVLAPALMAFPFELINVAVLVLLSGPGYLSAFTTSQLHAMAMFFLDISQQSTFIWEIFWGLWLIPFGLLVFKSKFIPKILGVLLLINGFSYITDSFIFLLLPVYHDVIRKFLMAPMIIGEFSIILWLLIVGARRKTE